ncbi:MAG: hypothetical protein BMS9Abin05_0847 [Rhodothermia bacterium]|nr:MAG: hypothetical protein BMS9Abin05_0847 [Rhodothermia bacterium]
MNHQDRVTDEDNDRASNPARQVLRQYWGYDDFRPGQHQIVESILAGHDTLAILPTGGGKSVCFQVPALLQSGVTLVISPLISLINDQVGALKRLGVHAECLTSEKSRQERRSILARARDWGGSLLYLSPERLLSLEFEKWAPQLQVSILAVDEAHCISEWGHEFRPSYRQICHSYDLMGRPPVIALTATATPAVRADICRSLKLNQPTKIVGGFDRPNLIFSVFSSYGKRKHLNEILKSVSGSAVVYAPTRKSVERWATHLATDGHESCAYHAGLSAEMRSKAQFQWLSNEKRIVVATSAFGMGIDKPDVRSVTHVGLPPSLESYYQEAGRAGRNGQKSYATVLFGKEDIARHRDFARRIRTERSSSGSGSGSGSGCGWRRHSARRLLEMLSYAMSSSCRRRQLLAHFGEFKGPRCGTCDVCLGRHRSFVPSEENERVLREILFAFRNELSPREYRGLSGIPWYRTEQMTRWLVLRGYLKIADDLTGLPSLTLLGRHLVAGDSVDPTPGYTTRRNWKDRRCTVQEPD